MTRLSPNELFPINFDAEQNKELFNYYDEDLRGYIKVISDKKTSTIQKNFFMNKLIEKWSPLLGFDKTQINQHIGDIQAPVSDMVTSFTLKQAMQHYDDTSNWLVPNLLRTCGLYIIAGLPKVGKSLLIYFLMYSVAISGKFLGRPTQKGKVLYIQLEEPPGTIAERLFLSGFGDMLDDDTSLTVNFGDQVLIERKFDLLYDIGWLIKKIKEYEPSLVIIDSLRMSSINSPHSENSGEFGKLVYRLQQVFNTTNTCGVLVHHMNKAGAKGGSDYSLVDSMSGHTSLSSATSGLIGLRREETEDGPLITLKTLPRDGTPITITYRIKPSDTGMWGLEKIWEDSPIGHPSTGKILRFLYQNMSTDKKFTIAEIATGIGVSLGDGEFRKCLEFLNSSQLIGSKYRGGFKYFFPEGNEWLVNSSSIRDTFDPSVLDANMVIRCCTKKELQDLFMGWDKERINKAIAYLLGPEKDLADTLAKRYLYVEGDIVLYKGGMHTVVKPANKASLYTTKYIIEGVDTPVLETELGEYLVELIEEEPVVVALEDIMGTDFFIDDDDAEEEDDEYDPDDRQLSIIRG